MKTIDEIYDANLEVKLTEMEILTPLQKCLGDLEFEIRYLVQSARFSEEKERILRIVEDAKELARKERDEPSHELKTIKQNLLNVLLLELDPSRITTKACVWLAERSLIALSLTRRGYECESCGERKVYGATEALLMFG